jgi:hypothetical protein
VLRRMAWERRVVRNEGERKRRSDPFIASFERDEREDCVEK